MNISRYLTALHLGLLPTPAFARGIVSLPEPSGMFLLALGIAGVAIGRRLSSRRPRD